MVIYLLAFYLIYDSLATTINVLDKGVVPLERNSVGIQFFIDVVNVDRTHNCRVLCWAKRCCLNDTEKPDCSIMKIFSGNAYNVKPKDRETILNVYPVLVQHDLEGYCEFVLNSKCGRSIRNVRRFVYIPFDTRVSTHWIKPHLMKNYIGDQKRADCGSLDENSLSECEPVNCDHKYAGARSFYETRQKKCIPATLCVDVAGKEMPDLVYVPKSNICRDLENPLSVKDVYDINTGTYVTTQPTSVVYKLRSNCSTISENLTMLKDLFFGKLNLNQNLNAVDYSDCVRIALLKVFGWIAFSTVLLMFCVLVMWIYTTDKSEHEKRGSYTVGSYWQSLRNICSTKKQMSTGKTSSYLSLSKRHTKTNAKVRNELLREVLVRDIPLELRESSLNICDRMDSQVRWKKRYRRQDLGSQISLKKGEESETDCTTEEDETTEKDKLLK